MRNKSPSLSIVIPCHNEEEIIQKSCNTLIDIIKRWDEGFISDYEIILVNNGSTDLTLREMLSIQNEINGIVVVDLRKNFGYQGSINAGLDHAKFDMVVTIEADLQDDPSKIYDMWRECRGPFRSRLQKSG